MNKLDPKSVWLFFFGSLTKLLVFVVVIGIWTSSFSTTLSESGIINLGGLGIVWISVIIFGLVFAYVWARLSYHFYHYELTENGFRKESGVIWKSYVTIPYDRIQNVDIFRGPLARILGLSDIQIQTAGMSSVGTKFAEGRLPGLFLTDAENLRNELVQRSGQLRNQGL